MIARKLKLILALGVVGLLGGSAPALAKGPHPYHDTRVTVGVGVPSWYAGYSYGSYRPAPRLATRVDYRLMRQGANLESQGEALVARGKNIEWRGRNWGMWHLVRKGQRLQSQGYELIQQGRDLQVRARW